MDNKGKKFSAKFLTRLIGGFSLLVVATVLTISFMVSSWLDYKNYYDTLIAEREHQKYINGLPLEFLGISAGLADGVIYYDNDSADPIEEDFVVKANFTEKGREFFKAISSTDYTISVPENFAKDGGIITVTYIYTPEKKDEDEDASKPIEAKAEIAITLVQPDETVFKIIQSPTFKESGYAENIEGTKKELPVLNMTDYSYTEKRGIATFSHIETGLSIRKRITDTLRIYNADGKSTEYNNVDCHFATAVPDLEIAYENDSFVLTAGAEKTVAFERAEADKIVFDGAGTFNVNGIIKTKSLTFNAGTHVNLTGNIVTDDLLADRGSEVNITVKEDDPIQINSAEGSARLYGAMTLTDTTKERTGIKLCGGANVYLCNESRVVIKNFYFAIGRFDGEIRRGYLCVPATAEMRDDGYYVESDHILNISDCNGSYLYIDEQRYAVDHDVTTPPTLTSEGSAKHKNGGTVSLPALDYKNYTLDMRLDQKKILFVHNETSINIEVPFDGTVPFRIKDLTVAYSEEDTCYTFTAGGDNVTIGRILTSKSVVFDGTGKLNIKGNVTVKDMTVKKDARIEMTGGISVDNLLVERGSTLDITIKGDDAIRIESPDGSARLYGNVSLKSTVAKQGTGIRLWGGARAIFCGESRVSARDFHVAVARFEGNIEKGYLYVPATAESRSNNYYVGENCIFEIFDCGTAYWNTDERRDATDYMLVTSPTIESPGLAKHYKDGELTLPALNYVDYSMIMQLEQNKIVFVHKQTNISVEVSFDGTVPFRIKDLTVAYSDNAYVFTANGENVAISGINGGSVVFMGTGKFNIAGNVVATSMTVKTGAWVDITGGIRVDNLVVEYGSTLDILALNGDDAIQINSNSGIAQLYGTVNISSTSKALGAAIRLLRDARVILCNESRIGIKDCFVAIACFDGENMFGILSVPASAVKNIDSYYIGDDCIFGIVDCANAYFRIDERRDATDYVLVTPPTLDSPGLAKHYKDGDLTLPALNYVDYSMIMQLDQNKIVFVHKQTNIAVDMPLDGTSSLQIGDLTVAYSDNAYVFTANGENVAISGINGGSVVFAGTGKFNIAGNVVATNMTVKTGARVDIAGGISVDNLLVERGSIVNVTVTDTDAVVIKSETGVAQLYGTVNLTGPNDKTGISLYNGAKIILDNQSKVVIKNFFVAIGDWQGGQGILCVPVNAEKQGDNYYAEGTCILEVNACSTPYYNINEQKND